MVPFRAPVGAVGIRRSRAQGHEAAAAWINAAVGSQPRPPGRHTATVRHDEVGEALEYLFWARDRILSAAQGLTDEEFRRDDTVTTRSLRATLVHQLECEWAWRIRLTFGSFPERGLVPESFETLGRLVERWLREERALRVWFEGLSEADLGAVPPQGSSPLSRARHLIYLVNHGTQQFSEAAVLLTRLGHSPGEIGYLAFCLRERTGGTPGDSR